MANGQQSSFHLIAAFFHQGLEVDNICCVVLNQALQGASVSIFVCLPEPHSVIPGHAFDLRGP